MHTVFSKPPFAGDRRNFSLSEICLGAEIRTKIRALVVAEKPFALNVACYCQKLLSYDSCSVSCGAGVCRLTLILDG